MNEEIKNLRKEVRRHTNEKEWEKLIQDGDCHLFCVTLFSSISNLSSYSIANRFIAGIQSCIGSIHQAEATLIAK